MRKYYLAKVLADCLLEQNAPLSNDEGGYYIMGWTQGVAELDLFNPRNNATYLCWMNGEKAEGIKAYLHEFTEALEPDSTGFVPGTPDWDAAMLAAHG